MIFLPQDIKHPTYNPQKIMVRTSCVSVYTSVRIYRFILIILSTDEYVCFTISNIVFLFRIIISFLSFNEMSIFERSNVVFARKNIWFFLQNSSHFDLTRNIYCRLIYLYICLQHIHIDTMYWVWYIRSHIDVIKTNMVSSVIYNY